MGSIRDVEAEILTAWRAFLSRGGRLPKTNDGKVNVSRLATALGISTNDAQYFYKKDAVRTTINEEALRQGLLPVGARNDELDEIRLLGLVKGLPPLIVYFYGGRVSRELDATIGNDLMSAWEITGHRAQGSEAERVVVLQDGQGLMTCEWLYMALTRGQRQVFLVGAGGALQAAVGRRSLRRTAFLQELTFLRKDFAGD